MSFLSKAWKGIRQVAAPLIGGLVPGPLGSIVGGMLGGTKTVGQVPSAPMPGAGFSMPGAGYGGTLTRTAGPMMLPALGRGAMALAPMLGLGAGRAVGFAAGRAVRSAMTYCRRNPGWCASIGGMAAVEGLIANGQLPIIKRRRARGITGRELNNFKRVSRVLNTWCKVPAPTQRARRKC